MIDPNRETVRLQGAAVLPTKTDPHLERQMTITFLAKTAKQQLGTLGLALGLGCAAGSALAAPITAGVSITGFTVSTSVADAYVWPVDAVAYQNWQMTALNAGGLLGTSTNTYSANDLNPVARLAQTSSALAKGDTAQFTDNFTQLSTYGFNLSASASPYDYLPAAPSNSANATALQSGGFTLIDAFGTGVAGNLVFTLYYDLDVSSPYGSAPGTYAEALLNLLASSDAGDSFSGADELHSFNEPGGVGSRSGFITWTFNLGADESAYYTLSGTAAAFAIPEPGAMLLASTSLLAMALAGRRRKAQPTPALAA
jgi:hypothetical protein